VDVAPYKKHCELDDFEAIEEFLENDDWLSQRSNQWTLTKFTKRRRIAPRPHIADTFETQEECGSQEEV
jgi:hypothetical protein